MSKSEFSKSELTSLDNSEMSVSGSPELRFAQNCMDYYSEWMVAHNARMQANQIPPGQTLVMLYEQAPLVQCELASKLGVTGQRNFRSGCTVENGIVACNENLRAILKVKQDFSDFNDAMTFVLTNLQDHHTFVMVLLSQRRVLIHQHGENLEDWCQNPVQVNMKDAGNNITPQIIRKELETFHNDSTRTPLCLVARHMWHSDDKGNPRLKDEPEKQVQSGLLLYLRGCFGRQTVFVDEEIPNPGGRLDIRLAYLAPKKATTILELKILDTVRGPKANLDWAISGVRQAHSYRREDTEAKFACVFDARPDKSDTMPSLYVAAKELDVEVAHFDMEVPPVNKKKANANAQSTKTKAAAAKKAKVAAPKNKKSAG